MPAGAGLTDVLAGRAELTDVLQRAPQSSNLLVLAAGSVPPNPSEVLGSARMSKLLTDLAKFATVIIDAPPILPVTDAAVLTHQADGALLVVNVGKTTYDLVEKSLDSLQKARGRTLGIVLNRIPLRGVNASPYAYAYTRSYTVARAGDEGLRRAARAAPRPAPPRCPPSRWSSTARPQIRSRPSWREGDTVAGDVVNPPPRGRRRG